MTRYSLKHPDGLYPDKDGKYVLYSEKDKAFMDAFREFRAVQDKDEPPYDKSDLAHDKMMQTWQAAEDGK